NAVSAAPGPARAGCPSVVAAATAAASGPAAPAAWRWRAASSPARPGVRRGPAPPAATGTPTDATATARLAPAPGLERPRAGPAPAAGLERRGPGRASLSAAAGAPLPRTIGPRSAPCRFFSRRLFGGRVARRQDQGDLLAQPGCLQGGGHVLDLPRQRRCVVPRRPTGGPGVHSGQGGFPYRLAERVGAARAEGPLLAPPPG